ncbi:MAG: M1 family metallopeptidase [Clostridiaceae bacterium]|jgi:hypothetical protein|nr:M1 family metallopeptidase [Clostridiaceae bacterium]
MNNKINKKWIIPFAVVIVLCALAALTFSACNNGSRGGLVADALTSYDIVADFNEDERTLTCFQDVQWVNDGAAVSELPLHLYANAFREGAHFPAVAEKYRSAAYYDGDSYGGIAITALTVEGEASDFVIGGRDNDILTVKIPHTAEGEAVNFSIAYKVTLAKCVARLGVNRSSVNLANFYPIIAARENGEFVTDPYYNVGDPFFSETADYFITLTVPENNLVASSGEEKRTYTENGRLTVELEAKSMRDFAAVFSPNFKKISDRTDGIDINYYYLGDKDAKPLLKTATDAIRTFNKAFGKYPWSSFDVAETEFLHGGMEFPGMVYVSSAMDGDNLHEVIIHETAHQWWYAAVGSNQVKNAWLDEGFSDFSVALFFKLNGDGERYSEIMGGTLASYSLYMETVKLAPTDMLRSIPEFLTESEYVIISYYKGALLFQSLYEILGEKTFLKSVSAYHAAYAFSVATPSDLIACFQKNVKTDIEPIFDAWISGKVVLM